MTGIDDSSTPADPSGSITDPNQAIAIDVMPNFTFGGGNLAVGEQRMVVININEISGEDTDGQVQVFIPYSQGLTFGFDNSMLFAMVIATETVNNPDWTLLDTGSGYLFTTNQVIAGGSRSRIAISITGDTAAVTNITANITAGSGGDTDDSNNIAVLTQAVNN